MRKLLSTVLVSAATAAMAAGMSAASPAARAASCHPAEAASWGGANLVSYDDSDFEHGAGNWVAADVNTTVAQDTAHAFLHSASLRLTAKAAGSQSAKIGTTQVAVTAGDSYRVSAWVKMPASSTGRSVTLALPFFTSGCTWIGWARGAAQPLASTTGWQYVSAVIAAPSGAASSYGTARITESGVAAGETLNADEVMLVPYRAAVVIGAKDPSTSGSAWASMNSTVGPSQVDKEFYSGQLPASYGLSNCANIQDVHPGVTCVQAYKTPTTNVASYVGTIPAGRNVILVFHQEPEGDYSSGAQFVSQFEGQASLIRRSVTRSNAENVFVAEDSSGYNYGTGRAGAGCSYTVPSAYADFYFMDHYMNPVSGRDSQTDGTAEVNSEFTNWVGCTGPQDKPLGFGEYGANCRSGMNPDDAAVAQTFAADNKLLEGQSFTGTVGGASPVTYRRPFIDWMYWWYDNTDNCQFKPGASPDGTGVASAWTANETQNGGGAG